MCAWILSVARRAYPSAFVRQSRKLQAAHTCVRHVHQCETRANDHVAAPHWVHATAVHAASQQISAAPKLRLDTAEDRPESWLAISVLNWSFRDVNCVARVVAKPACVDWTLLGVGMCHDEFRNQSQIGSSRQRLDCICFKIESSAACKLCASKSGVTDWKIWTVSTCVADSSRAASSLITSTYLLTHTSQSASITCEQGWVHQGLERRSRRRRCAAGS